MYTLKCISWQILLFGGLLCFSLGAAAQTRTISGTVRSDADHQPFPGVTVRVKDSPNGATTDNNGKFTLQQVNPGAILVFTAIGFVTQERKVGQSNTIEVILQEDKTGLNEIVVTGYRSQTRGTITGSVTSVNGDALKNTPYDNLSNALAGRLSGVTVTQQAGTPGQQSSIRVRGLGTFNNSDPLYVIDGVVSDKFAFDGLSPNDVQTITVLKDGASAAIYGSRAANGVVLVTTKTGQTGRAKFTYSGIIGFQSPTKVPKTLNAFQQATAINDALKYNSVPETDQRYYTQDELDYFKTHSWNWIDALWKDPLTTQHNMDLSGGTDKVKYFLGGSYNFASGSFNNLNYQKLGIRGNISVDVTKDFKVTLNFNADKRNTKGPSWQIGNTRQEDLYKALLFRTSMVPPYIKGLPVGNWVEWHPGVVTTPSLAGYDNREWTELNNILTLEYKIPAIQGLGVKASINGFKRDIYEKQFNLPYNMTLFNTRGGHNHIVGDSAVGIRPRAADEFLRSRYEKLERYQFDAQINYNRSFGKHTIDALLVYEQAEGDDIWFNGQRNNFISTSIDQYVASSPVNPQVNGEESQDARISYVGLLGYNYAQKYMIETSFRYDGSTVFAPSQRWGFFPSISAGWRISEEPFFKDNVGFINDLKLRGSVALVGNDDVGSFQWLQSYDIIDGGIFDNATNGLKEGSLANPGITWEKSLSYNAGLDSRLWENKIDFKLDLFYRHTYDILGSRQLSTPSTLGATLPDENYQQIDSKGFEVTVGYASPAVANKDAISYHVSANFGFATNKIVRVDEAENLRPYESAIGRPVGLRSNGNINKNGNYKNDQLFGYVATGIIRTQKDLDALPAGYTILGRAPTLGMMNYKDLRGPTSDAPDGKITSDDQQFLGKYSIPPMDFGATGEINWKSFSVTVLIQGVAGAQVMMPTTGRDLQARAEESGFAYWADSWTPDNPNGKYPGYRGTSYRTRSDVSSFWLMNDSFLRLKNVSLSYNLSQNVLSKLHISSFQVYATGSNLLMIYSKNKIYDPEQALINSYPIMKTFSLGLNLGL